MKCKNMLLISAIFTLSIGLVQFAYSADQPGGDLVEAGKKLFNDPALGGSKNDQTCNSCHKDGAKLSKAGKNPSLTRMINSCIRGPLKGEPLATKSTEMKALRAYIISLEK